MHAVSTAQLTYETLNAALDELALPSAIPGPDAAAPYDRVAALGEWLRRSLGSQAAPEELQSELGSLLSRMAHSPDIMVQLALSVEVFEPLVAEGGPTLEAALAYFPPDVVQQLRDSYPDLRTLGSPRS